VRFEVLARLVPMSAFTAHPIYFIKNDEPMDKICSEITIGKMAVPLVQGKLRHWHVV